MKKFGLLFSILILASQLSLAQIAAWDFNGNGGNEASVDATTLNANLNPSTIMRGIGLTASSLTNSFSSSGFSNGSTVGEAITAEDYLQFTINAKAGYNVSLSSLDANFRRSSTGPATFQWEYSLDGFTTAGVTFGGEISYTSTTTNGLAQTQIDLTGIASLQNVTSSTTITIRLFGYNASATSGTFAIGRLTGNDLAIGGTVTTIGGVANPSSFSSTTASTSQINLSWAQNGNNDNVMLAWNSTNSFGTPSGSYNVNDAITGGGTVIYNGSGISYPHTGLTPNTTYYYKAWSINGAVVYSDGVISNATTLKEEPTDYPSSFSSVPGAPDYSAINLSWTDASGGTVPDGYLIKASTTSYTAIVDPVDGTAESNSTLVRNVTQGTQASNFSGLTASTTYYFKIYPYTNSGSNINYKTDAIVPQTSRTTNDIPTVTPLNPKDIIITHLSADYNGSSDEFVVLFNNTDNSVDLNGYELQYFAASGNTGGAGHSFITSSIILSRSYILLSPNATVSVGSVNVDRDFDFTSGMSTSGQMVFRETANTSNIIYAAAWGTITGYVAGMTDAASWPEDGMIQLTPSGNSYIRTSYNSSNTQYSHISSANITSIPNSESSLPVELTSFSATTFGSTVKLSWNTATEINNYGFELERRSNIKGQTSDEWTKIGFVNGNGNSNSPKNYSFVDDKVAAGKYSYRLKQIDNDGQFEFSKTIEVDINGVKKFELSQNYPNPFNPTTTIKFNLPESGMVKLTLYNILGQQIRTLVNEFKESGSHTIDFDASELNSGMYIYKIESGSFTQTRKMTLIK